MSFQSVKNKTKKKNKQPFLGTVNFGDMQLWCTHTWMYTTDMPKMFRHKHLKQNVYVNMNVFSTNCLHCAKAMFCLSCIPYSTLSFRHHINGLKAKLWDRQLPHNSLPCVQSKALAWHYIPWKTPGPQFSEQDEGEIYCTRWSIRMNLIKHF